MSYEFGWEDVPGRAEIIEAHRLEMERQDKKRELVLLCLYIAFVFFYSLSIFTPLIFKLLK